MKRPIAWFAVLSASLTLGSAVFTGCGDDDPGPTTGGGGTGGTGGSGGGTAGKGGGAGSSGSAGTGGTGGTAGTGGRAGSGGTAGSGGKADSGADTGGPMTIACGTKMCAATDIGMGMILPPCCPTGEMNACGLMFPQGICFTETPGRPDARCPAVTVPNIPTPIPGCCTATGICGGEIGAPLGCNDLSPFTGGAQISCSGDAGTPPADSGSDGTSPPNDSGPADTGTDDAPGDTGGGDGGGNDSGTGDAPTDGGRSDGGPSDASGDRAG